jgi:hypothetical protein
VGVVFFIGKSKVDGNLCPFLAGVREFSPVDQVLNVLHGGLIHVEVSVHGILGDDRGEDRLVGDDQVAARAQRSPDAAANGRGDLGPAEIELGRLPVGPGGVQGCAGGLAGGQVFLQFFLGNGSRAYEL